MTTDQSDDMGDRAHLKELLDDKIKIELRQIIDNRYAQDIEK